MVQANANLVRTFSHTLHSPKCPLSEAIHNENMSIGLVRDARTYGRIPWECRERYTGSRDTKFKTLETQKQLMPRLLSLGCYVAGVDVQKDPHKSVLVRVVTHL